MATKKRKEDEVPLARNGHGDPGAATVQVPPHGSSPSPIVGSSDGDDDSDLPMPSLTNEEKRRRVELAKARAGELSDRRSFSSHYPEFERKSWTLEETEKRFQEHIMKIRRHETFFELAERRAREPFEESCQWLCLPTSADSSEGRSVGNADWLRRVTKQEKDDYFFKSFSDVGEALFDSTLREIYVPVDEKYCHVLMAHGAIRRHHPVYADYIHHALCTSQVSCRYGEYSLLEAVVTQHATVLLRDTERFTKCVMRDGSRYAVSRWSDWYIETYGEAQTSRMLHLKRGKQLLDFYTVFSDSLTIAEQAVARYRVEDDFWWENLTPKQRKRYDDKADPHLRKDDECYPF